MEAPKVDAEMMEKQSNVARGEIMRGGDNWKRSEYLMRLGCWWEGTTLGLAANDPVS